MSEIVFLRLLNLLNSALWNEKPDESLFVDMDGEAWEELYKFSVRHGVIAIAFDGLMRLSANLRPPLKLRLTWGASTEQIERNYQHKQKVADELLEIFSQEQIRMMVFKGLSLSAYHPVPAHREFGDIDIFLFGKHKEGDVLMVKAGAKQKNNAGYKHSNFYYKGVPIENHAYLLNVRESRKIADLNQTLLDILEQDEQIRYAPAGKVLFPPPDFMALFFIVHAIRHLMWRPLPLRACCDWALFLHAHAGKLDIDRWKAALHKAELLDTAEALTALTVKWFNLPDTIFPVDNHPQWKRFIGKDMRRPFSTLHQPTTSLGLLYHKLKQLYIVSRRYSLIYGGNTFTHYVHKIFRSIRHSIVIFNSR